MKEKKIDYSIVTAENLKDSAFFGNFPQSYLDEIASSAIIIKAEKDLSEEKILNIAKNEKLLDKYLNNKSIKKVIFVKNRLINILVNE